MYPTEANLQSDDIWASLCLVRPTSLITYLFRGAEFFLRSQPVLSYSRNSPHFMEPEGSLPRLQVPATCLYPEQIDPVHAPHPTSRRSIFILSTHLGLGLSSCLFPSGFPTKILYTALLSAKCATCPAHLILLDFITQVTLGEKYISFSSSLCSLLLSPVISPKYSPQHPILQYPQPKFIP